MRSLSILALWVLSANSFGHYAVKRIACRNVEPSQGLSRLEFAFRVTPTSQMIGVEQISLTGAEKFLEGQVWERAAEGITTFEYRPATGQGFAKVETRKGNLSFVFQTDDLGTSVTSYLQNGRVKKVSFYRCAQFPS